MKGKGLTVYFRPGGKEEPGPFMGELEHVTKERESCRARWKRSIVASSVGNEFECKADQHQEDVEMQSGELDRYHRNDASGMYTV